MQAHNLVMGEGNPSADLFFIGEAPGKQEDLTGKPFIGAAGKMLSTMLESISLSRDDVYITNIVKYRPPNNRDPRPEEVRRGVGYLQQQIEAVSPKLVIFLGRHSMKVFFPNLVIGEVHGQVIEQEGRKYLPLYHPAAALYNGGLRQTLMQDFAQIPKLIVD